MFIKTVLGVKLYQQIVVCVRMWACVCVCVLMQCVCVCVCVCVSYLLQVFLPFLLLKCPLVLLDETFPPHPACEQSQRDQLG